MLKITRYVILPPEQGGLTGKRCLEQTLLSVTSRFVQIFRKRLYITKPFGTAELLARVRAALRMVRVSSQVLTPGSVFSLDDMTIDYDRRQVCISGTPVHMTQTEYNILAYLSQHVGKVLTYSAIIRAIWGNMDNGSIKKLQVNMANIRKKLGCQPGENRYIVNELGVGYRMQQGEETV